jgi:hypothetical protein
VRLACVSDARVDGAVRSGLLHYNDVDDTERLLAGVRAP